MPSFVEVGKVVLEKKNENVKSSHTDDGQLAIRLSAHVSN